MLLFLEKNFNKRNNLQIQVQPLIQGIIQNFKIQLRNLIYKHVVSKKEPELLKTGNISVKSVRINLRRVLLEIFSNVARVSDPCCAGVVRGKRVRVNSLI